MKKNQNKFDQERKDKMVKVGMVDGEPESWYPNYEGNLVKVSFMKLCSFSKKPRDRILNAEMWRVCIWGADDMGMERDFVSRSDALEMFKTIEDGVTREELEVLYDFQRA